MTKPRRRPQEDLHCGYCGGPADDRDHVVPRCIFGKSPPPHLVTIPSCKVCNRRKAEDDIFLRDYLTADIEGHQHPVAASLFYSKVIRSIVRNRSELAAIASMTPAREVDLISPAGIYAGKGVRITIPDGRLDRVIFQMARGLYFDSRKERLDEALPYWVRRHRSDMWATLANGPFKDKPAKVLGNIFECAYMFASEVPSKTLWLMRFYQQVIVTVGTGSRNESERTSDTIGAN